MDKQELQKLRDNLPQQFSEAQLAFISFKTPAVFIKKRKGRGGKELDYVEVGYIYQRLNAIFGFGAWDWEYSMVEPLSFPNTEHIVVRGRLTVRAHDKETGEIKGTVVKTATGGQPINYMKDTKIPVDLADDEKIAAADAIKKAASLLGIAADVYYPRVTQAVEEIMKKQKASSPPITVDPATLDSESESKITANEDNTVEPKESDHITLIKKIFGVSSEINQNNENYQALDSEGKKKLIKEFLKTRGLDIPSFARASDDDLDKACILLKEKLEEMKGVR